MPCSVPSARPVVVFHCPARAGIEFEFGISQCSGDIKRGGSEGRSRRSDEDRLCPTGADSADDVSHRKLSPVSVTLVRIERFAKRALGGGVTVGGAGTTVSVAELLVTRPTELETATEYMPVSPIPAP